MKKNSMLYIAGQTHVTTLNTKLEFLSSWEFPKDPPSFRIFRGLKVDGNRLYLVIYGLHQIFVCNPPDGKILKEFGPVNEGSKVGEFNCPIALAVDHKYLYICDGGNHRVQILKKKNGSYFSKWGNGIQSTEQGQFSFPRSIYNSLSEAFIYVGDEDSVQLFTREGICIQRLGGFTCVHGVCVMNDRLYVTDRAKEGILIFKRQIN